VDNEISSCEKAKIIQDIPINIIETNLGQPLNNSSANYNPVISQDENTIVFMTDLKFYNAIYQSKRINGKWTEPENITPQVGSDGNAVPTSLSYDGKELFKMILKWDN
jgi:Tol biopolymer transport system component